MRHIFIGDVHGCYDELRALLRKLGRSDEDQLVFVGDLVAKGPDSASVVSLCRSLGAHAVVGNHDEAVLRIVRARREGSEPSKAKKAHLRVADSLSAADVAWLEALPTWLDYPELERVVVHAGRVPGVPVAQQDKGSLITMRTLRADGTPSSRLDEGVLWATRWQGPEHVIFGHDAVTGLQRHTFATGLDTGCVYGNALTALVLPDELLVSVDARRAYAEVDP